MDKIFLRKLEFWGLHGVNDEEKIHKQKFLISADIFFDATNAKNLDDINHTISYAAVYKIIAHETTTNSFGLLEKLAEHLIQVIKKQFPKITRIDIEIAKFPMTWINRNYESVGFACSKSFL